MRFEMEQPVLSIVRPRPYPVDAVGTVAALRLPQCWIGAGFLRAGVGRIGRLRPAEAEVDRPWSVRSPTRMHLRNDDPPYAGTADAVAKRVETPTAVAVRRGAGGALDLMAPHGLADLLHLIVRPTPHFRHRPEV